MFEVMGSWNRVSNDRVENMVDMVNKRFPRKQPRTLIAAYYKNMSEEVRNEIRDQIVEEARKAGLM
jgi:hypothetical protein